MAGGLLAPGAVQVNNAYAIRVTLLAATLSAVKELAAVQSDAG
jgi:hypothetical protein